MYICWMTRERDDARLFGRCSEIRCRGRRVDILLILERCFEGYYYGKTEMVGKLVSTCILLQFLCSKDRNISILYKDK